MFGVVLLAAALHASWNAIVKGARDTGLATVTVAGSATLISALLLPFFAPPAPASWPFLVASTCCQIGYYGMLAATYRAADMSRAYPVMRGAAPLLVAMASGMLFAERVSATAWTGIALICLGISGMAFAGRGDLRGIRLALLTALFIATYTLIDGLGVRRSGAPASYTLWLFFLTGLPIILWATIRDGGRLRDHLRAHGLAGLVGGAGTLLSYGLALWAMTFAPIAVVAALRETSILFALAIAGLILREKIGLVRQIAGCVMVAGVALLRLG